VTIDAQDGTQQEPEIVNELATSNAQFSQSSSVSFSTTVDFTTAPADNVVVVLDVPESFANSVEDSTIELFSSVENAGAAGNFIILTLIEPSTYDSSAMTLTATLPVSAFSQLTPGANGAFRAYLRIVSTPGTSTARRHLRLGDSHVHRRQLQSCEAAIIMCPVTDCNIFTPFTFNRGGRPPLLGIDLNTTDTNVMAVADGVVVEVGGGGFLGNRVIIKHTSDQATSLYGFLSGVSASVGQTVVAGQVIGQTSSISGYEEDYFVHLEYAPSGLNSDIKRLIDPFPCIESAVLTDFPSFAPSSSIQPSVTSAPS